MMPIKVLFVFLFILLTLLQPVRMYLGSRLENLFLTIPDCIVTDGCDRCQAAKTAPECAAEPTHVPQHISKSLVVYGNSFTFKISTGLDSAVKFIREITFGVLLYLDRSARWLEAVSSVERDKKANVQSRPVGTWLAELPTHDSVRDAVAERAGIESDEATSLALALEFAPRQYEQGFDICERVPQMQGICDLINAQEEILFVWKALTSTVFGGALYTMYYLGMLYTNRRIRLMAIIFVVLLLMGFEMWKLFRS